MIEDLRDAPLTPRNADQPQSGMDAVPALKTRAGTDADEAGTAGNAENPMPPETLAALDALVELRHLYRAYVRLLEIGRDRIVDLGGSCDPVDVMEAGDPALRRAREAIDRLARIPTPPQGGSHEPR